MLGSDLSVVWPIWPCDQSDGTLRRCQICCTGGPASARSASSAPSTSTCCRRATPAARPGRTSRPGWRTPRPVTTSERGGNWSLTIRCRRFTAGSATTRVRASATAPASTAPSRFIPSSGSSAISRSSGDGRSTRPRSPAASGCWSSAPVRAGFPPPTIWPGAAIRWRSGMRRAARETCHCEWPAGVLSAGLGASAPPTGAGSVWYQDRQIRRCTGMRRGMSRRPGMKGMSRSRRVPRPVM